MPEMTDELIPTAEAAVILRVSVATVNRMAQRGELTPALKGPGLTSARWFRRADVEALAS